MSEELKIVGLLCNWCCYGGADTAGTARMQYPPNIRIIRVMCSGRINPSMIFKAFQEGANVKITGIRTTTARSIKLKEASMEVVE